MAVIPNTPSVAMDILNHLANASLRTCPRCGVESGEARTSYNTGSDAKFYVFCKNCNLTTKCFQSAGEAITYWNNSSVPSWSAADIVSIIQDYVRISTNPIHAGACMRCGGGGPNKHKDFCLVPLAMKILRHRNNG